MSTSLSTILKRFAFLFVAAGVLFAITMVFTYDIIKIDWPSFMEIQPSFRPMEAPLPPPARSIPIDGPAFIPNMGAPENPVSADATSVARGAELFMINCAMCHGETGEGDGPIATQLQNKPANLTSETVQSKSDGALFLTITNGVTGRMPALNENFTVRERWDIVNFLRTLMPATQ
jgi:mono/diheme cytochrome c family protein